MGWDDAAWDTLVSDLYLSAADPAAAARLPDCFAGLTGGITASCWQMRPRDCAIVGNLATNGPIEAQAAYRDHYYQLDPWQPATLRVRSGTVVRGADVIDSPALARSAFYNEFGAVFGLFHMVGILVPIGRGDAVTVGVVSILRPRERDDFDDGAMTVLQRLLPHVASAFRLRGQLVAAAGESAAALSMIRDALTRCTNPHGLLRLPPGRGRDRLAGLIAAAARGEAGGVCRMSGSPDLLLSVDPLPRPLAALAGAPVGRVLVLLRPLGAPCTLPAQAAAAFGLTEAEAAVAAALAAGESPAEIAAARGVKVSTVRTLLARAQDKSNSHNLRDLVRVLLSLGS